VLGGAVVGPEALVEDVRWNTTEFVGAIMQPFEAWLVLQFLETLSMRMARHSANAQQVAEFLAGHPRVVHVNYPGLPDHPLHPPTITHEHMTPEERAAAGIDDGLIRFSVGLEDPEDIIADLDQALARL
jgi:methionine-gamma-lyase